MVSVAGIVMLWVAAPPSDQVPNRYVFAPEVNRSAAPSVVLKPTAERVL